MTLTLTTRPAAGLRQPPGQRPYPAARGRDGVRRAVLGPTTRRPTSYDEAYAAMQRTEAYWREWLSRGNFPDHPWRSYLQRSALVLKGLTYMPTGALLAAATTSLPETPHGERNWDYRYSWVRDATFTLWGLYTLGLRPRGQRLLPASSPTSAAGPPRPAGACTASAASARSRSRRWTTCTATRVRGRCASATRRTSSSRTTSGARSSTRSTCTPRAATTCPSRSGRWWCARSRTRWPTGATPTAASGRCAASPGTSCRPSSCAGSPPTAAPGWPQLREDDEQAEAWREQANVIHDDICAHGVDDRGVFTQYYGSKALDASALLLPLFRFLPADDERIRATVLAIADELRVDGMVKRYLETETDDGMTGEEGAFAICSFWLVSAMAEIGETEPGPRAVRKAALVRQPAAAVRRGDRPAHRAHAGQLPAGVHPPRADQRGHARHPWLTSGLRRLDRRPRHRRAVSGSSWAAGCPRRTGRWPT